MGPHRQIISCYPTAWPILLLFVIVISSTGEEYLENKAACFTDGLRKEMSLRCNESYIIWVKSHHYGYQEIPQDNGQCQYQTNDQCTFRSPETNSILMRNCMGKGSCDFYVMLPSTTLIECASHPANYFQVDFVCVPEEVGEKGHIIDICGDAINSEALIRKHGYIESPNYPSYYPPDVSCSCNLSTVDNDAHVELTVVDLEMEKENPHACRYDWLELLSGEGQWGSGTRLCSKQLTNTTLVESNDVKLFLKSDGYEESRGFWIKYEGKYSNGNAADVKVKCAPFTPLVSKHATKCLPQHNVSEAYLHCDDIGVINVLEAYSGLAEVIPDPKGETNQESKECKIPEDDSCRVEAYHYKKILKDCMGQDECNAAVDMVPLPTCNVESNYFRLEYECIPNANDPNYIVDICGDGTRGPIRRRHGFIESPNYPGEYPPHLSCTCRLQTTEDASIKIKLLDVELYGRRGEGRCGTDWLEFRGHDKAWDSGRRLCDEKLGTWILTDIHDIYIDFYTDLTGEDRGFWLEYSAVQQDQTETHVAVTCGSNNDHPSPRPPDSNPPFLDTLDGETKVPTESGKSTSNIGLIIGVIVVALLLVLLVSAMVLYKVSKSRKKKGNGNSGSPSISTTTPLDKSYPGFKKYSAFASSHLSGNQYDTLTNDSPVILPTGAMQAGSSSASSGIGSLQEEYMGSSNLPASYLNPAFDSSMDGIHPTNANPTV